VVCGAGPRGGYPTGLREHSSARASTSRPETYAPAWSSRASDRSGKRNDPINPSMLLKGPSKSGTRHRDAPFDALSVWQRLDVLMDRQARDSAKRRADYLTVDGREQPAETQLSTAVSARFMVRTGSPAASSSNLSVLADRFYRPSSVRDARGGRAASAARRSANTLAADGTCWGSTPGRRTWWPQVRLRWVVVRIRRG
jgi:hypothetical protein